MKDKGKNKLLLLFITLVPQSKYSLPLHGPRHFVFCKQVTGERFCLKRLVALFYLFLGGFHVSIYLSITRTWNHQHSFLSYHSSVSWPMTRGPLYINQLSQALIHKVVMNCMHFHHMIFSRNKLSGMKAFQAFSFQINIYIFSLWPGWT